ncbi:unnamed protein product [Adineta ricciae]|uniref:Uncharacterized protein n=1 Tax=Adineta ricciae TaxID=249248 RepID=A0A814I9E2_ADIRI|nr:unnamed protein product [Adineta ricciae]
MENEVQKRSCFRYCCPNGCCGYCKPPSQEQKQVDDIFHVDKAVVPTDIPYGFIKFYSGVRTVENTYTCPILSFHLYRHAQHRARRAQDNRTMFLDNNNRVSIRQDEQQASQSEQNQGEEDVMMVPLEDIINVSFKAEFTKNIDADVKTTIEPTYERSENCCDRCAAPIISCCRKTRDICCCISHGQTKIAPRVETTIFVINGQPNTTYREEDLPLPEVREGCCTHCTNKCRCWCCRRNILVKLTKKIHSKAERKAERVITMTVEYVKYSNIDTPSHVRLLTGQEQANFYKDKFHVEKELKFYLVNNNEFDPTNFDMKKEQAEALCRMIKQLKGMRSKYPSETDLSEILNQSHLRTFGQVFAEPVL